MESVRQSRTAGEKPGFFEELRQQRWDDHRYYHHSRINQSLHLLSATCFLSTYFLVAFSPSAAALLGWFVAMWSRQIGHFFFEPKSYDEVNHASHDYKERIKIGYNLRRKRVLLGIWALSPTLLWLDPTAMGLFSRPHDWRGYVDNLALTWLYLAVAALLFRTIHLFFIRDVQTGLVWATKIMTDPFNDFRIYFKSPFYLLKGELIDPMIHVQHGVDCEDELSLEPAAR